MAATDPRVDAYIAKQADFARPILSHIRAQVHAACPDVAEAMKWSMPFFVLNGKNLANMAGFKAHAAFGFWQGRAIAGVVPEESATAMGQFGRLTGIADLPPDDTFRGMIAQAAARIESGAAAPRAKAAPRPDLPVPPELERAIAADPAAAAHWSAFTPGKIRDYAEWIGEAKRPETRDKRIAQAVEWIAQGKDRNWKYRTC